MIFMRKFIAPLLLLLLVIVVFHSWFLPGVLSTFDFLYFSPIMMKDASVIPYAWGWHIGFDGLSRFISPYSWILPFISIPQFIFGRLGMDWSFIARIMYLYPFLIFMIVSPILLIRYVFPKNRFYLLSILVFSFNTYSLLLAGGEVFLALAYALSPMVLIIFMKIINCTEYRVSSIKYSIIAGLLLSVQIIFDPRITYVTMSAVMLYLVLSIKLSRKKILYTLQLILYTLVIPLGATVLLHAFWIIPSLLYGSNPVEALGAAYSTSDAVKYLSFAKFENTISLLHSNWPENIFGKVYFMRSEFLLIPILAFSSMFFLKNLKNNKEKLYIIFFASLGLIGAFLSKGVNDPFGDMYSWMFKNIPGFIMFRDPAKWYLLVAISYSVLIPFTVWKVYELIKFKTNNLKFKIAKYTPALFIFLILCYLLFLIRPAILGQVGGMLKTTVVPNDYVKLEKFLYNQKGFYRTLWVPSKQRFGYYSNTHPEISAQVLFNLYENNILLEKLSDSNTENFLREASIKYVIVPYDSEGEIFLTDRKYNKKLYIETIGEINKVTWLKRHDGFGSIAVFEVSSSKDHFYISEKNVSSNKKVKYKFINPTKYKVTVENVNKGDILVFSESFDSKWIIKNENNIHSQKYNKLFNSFILPKSGTYSLIVYYEPQDWVNIGLIVSGLTLTLILIFFGFGYLTKRW